jgi:2-oxoisovalerate dehydrogenase E1 component
MSRDLSSVRVHSPGVQEPAPSISGGPGDPGFRVYRESDLALIEPYRILTPEGLAVRKISIEDSVLIGLFEEMVFARLFDARASNMGALGQLGGYPPLLGQEAAQVGMAHALAPGDWFAPMYRDSAAMIARGIPPEQILQYYTGDERGLRLPPELKVLPFAIPVASQLLHADGLALASLLAGRNDVVLTTTGDGGTSTGAFHEALNFAGSFRLPIVFGVENNQFAISVPRRVQTASRTIAQKALAYGIQGVLVDGNDLLAVHEVTKYAVDAARQRQPFLLEYVTYRRGFHTTSEFASHKLRTEPELAAWEKLDPIDRVRKFLLRSGRITEKKSVEIEEQARVRLKAVVERLNAIGEPDPNDMFRYVYSRAPASLVRQAYDALGDAAALGGIGPEAPEPTGVPGGTQDLNLRNAINSTLRQEMERNPRIVVFGEDVGELGGVFQVTKGLKATFGDRVFDTPLAEACIAGLFVGLSIGGFVPVAEFQFDGFTHPAYDQILNHVARLRHRTRGAFPLRGVIRFPYGAGVHALEHHSDSPETYFIHGPGLTVVAPSSPADAKGLLMSALRADDPVIFMEPKKIYDAPKAPVPQAPFTIPLGKAHRLTEGSQLTVVTYGSMVYPTLEAVEGCDAEVIDLRTLCPLDFPTILRSVEKTGRLVIVHEAPRTLGLGAEIAATVADDALLHLKAPIKRVTGYDIVDPLRKLEDRAFPNSGRIARAVREVLAY